MTLKEYFSAYGIKQNWFARQIGIEPSRLNHYIAGRTPPPLKVAIAILRETKGQVTVEDLARTSETS